MKTPIQELIERLSIRIKESKRDEEPEAVIEAMENCLVDLKWQLPKEKKAIADAHDEGLSNQESYGGVSYFNETYDGK